MTIVQTEDKRNQEWRKSNIGSKLLGKMGWKEGDGIGKRNVNTVALRAVKRQEGLGIGAKRQTEGGPSESTGTFASVLANLQAVHAVPKPKSKKEAKKLAKKAAKRAAKKKLSLPQNKVVAGHARKMRAAKFGAKSAEELACIFGNTEVVNTALGGAVPSPFGTIAAIGSSSSKKKRKTKDSSSSSEDECPKEASTSENESSDASCDKNESKKSRKEKEATKDKKPKKDKKSKKEKKKKSKTK